MPRPIVLPPHIYYFFSLIDKIFIEKVDELQLCLKIKTTHKINIYWVSKNLYTKKENIGNINVSTGNFK